MKGKKPLIIAALVVVVLVVAFSAVKTILENGLRTLAETRIEEVDLGRIADGEYPGSFSTFPVSVRVDVTVVDHRISKIDLLEHTNGQGKPAEALLAKVVEEQKIDLDAVAGATYSSKVILKAIENALGK